MLKALKGFIYEEDASAPTKPVAQAPIQNQGTPMGYQPQAMQVNNQFVDALRQALKARSSAFTGLLSAADKLTNVIPDPNTRLKAAFEMVKGEGRGVREIAAAIEIHASDLEAQRMSFEQALQREQQSTVGALKAELDRLAPANKAADDQIKSMQAQMASLQELINKNAARQAEIAGQIANEDNRIASSKQQFETALSVVRSELEGQKTVILTALS